jgi:DNA-binding NarL/FixJ family response regulator
VTLDRASAPPELLGIAREILAQGAAAVGSEEGGTGSPSPETMVAAAERVFGRFHVRLASLAGNGGFRSLLELAHLRTVGSHSVLEGMHVTPELGLSLHSGSREGATPTREGASNHEPDTADAALSNALTALLAEVLALLRTLARDQDWTVVDLWPGLVALKKAGLPPRDPAAKDGDSVGNDDKPWRLLVMDRDHATCEAFGRTLAEAVDFRVVDTATSSGEAKRKMEGGAIDFVVASAHMETPEILAVSRWLRKQDPANRPHLLVTGLPQDEATILKYLENGASGFTLGEFSIEGLRLALRLMARGEALVPMRLVHLLITRVGELAELVRDRGLDPANVSDLTPRERDVLALLDQSLTNKDIARRLYVSEGTVKSHVHQILRKLKVRRREEAVRVFRLHRASRRADEP